MDTKGVAKVRVSRVRGPGRAKGDRTQQGGRGVKKEEIINDVTESNEATGSRNRGMGKRGQRGRPGKGESRGKGPDTVGEPEGREIDAKCDTIRVRVSRVRDNENGTGHREEASREGIQGRGRGGQVRGRGPGRAKGDLTQQGGRGGKKEEIINEVTESNEDTRRKGFTRSKGATGSNGDTRSNEGTIRKGDTRSKGDTESNEA
ncbi:hypothetical protein SKAU_G00225520, partial [Synaphobranchus kaupii]